VATVLALLCFAVPAWITQQIIVRAYYARADTVRPMLLGTTVALASIPLYLALGRRDGVRGLALAAAIAMTVNALATVLWARWLHGAPALGPLLGTAARAALVAVPAAAVARWLGGGATESVAQAAVTLAIGGGLFAATAAAGIALVGDEPMRALLRRFSRQTQANADDVSP
jgi:putative peptidoglycan lipid II flippase